MKTLDGYELTEGESCWVVLQCAEGTHHLSNNYRAAVYLDDECKRCGWDFHILKPMRCDCEAGEVVGVWKNKPD